MIVSPRTGPGNDSPVAGLSIDPKIFVFIDVLLPVEVRPLLVVDDPDDRDK